MTSKWAVNRGSRLQPHPPPLITLCGRKGSGQIPRRPCESWKQVWAQLSLEVCTGVLVKELFQYPLRACEQAKRLLQLVRWRTSVTNRLAHGVASLKWSGKDHLLSLSATDFPSRSKHWNEHATPRDLKIMPTTPYRARTTTSARCSPGRTRKGRSGFPANYIYGLREEPRVAWCEQLREARRNLVQILSTRVCAQLQRCISQQIHRAPQGPSEASSDAVSRVGGQAYLAGNPAEMGKPLCWDSSCCVGCKRTMGSGGHSHGLIRGTRGFHWTEVAQTLMRGGSRALQEREQSPVMQALPRVRDHLRSHVMSWPGCSMLR